MSGLVDGLAFPLVAHGVNLPLCSISLRLEMAGIVCTFVKPRWHPPSLVSSLDTIARTTAGHCLLLV